MLTRYTTTHAGASYAVRTANYAHPDYEYFEPIWRTIRDAEAGEHAVKRNAQKYLPKLAGHDWEQYKSYLQRATYYNATARTIAALYGAMFTRPAKVEGFTPPARFSKDGMSLNLSAKTAAKEVISLGRYGMLVDADPEGRADPYVACYTAENIIDWEVVDGRLIRVLLREAEVTRNASGMSEIATKFRMLALEPGPDGFQYVQYVWNAPTGVPDLQALPDHTAEPTVRGQRLRYIPFQFVGPFSNSPNVQKPPMLDIVTLNFSHYHSYAELEQGRFHTANPVYTVSSGTADDESGEYYVGPDMVWELGKDGKAEILEYRGTGLRSLESALADKERQMAAIGGRMLPSEHTGPGEGPNALRAREAAERTLVLSVADCIDEAFTTVLTWLADWSNKPTKSIEFAVSREWTAQKSDPREWRAIVGMYKAGHLPLDVLHKYLQANDIVPEWLGIEDFGKLLNDEKQFPNMPEVIARMRGYPDAKTWVADR